MSKKFIIEDCTCFWVKGKNGMTLQCERYTKQDTTEKNCIGLSTSVSWTLIEYNTAFR